MVEIPISTSNESEKIDAKIVVRQANSSDVHYAVIITDEMEASAKARGTGIAKRTPEYVAQKMVEGKAVIAHLGDGTWVGFCYIEAWGHGQFVANSGLIVSPAFRKTGVATQIKKQIFELSRTKFPDSKIFGLTTGLAVMKMNSEIGYVPVTYSELTNDEEFWAGCKSCVNYEILQSKERKNCLCTAMLYDPPKREATIVNAAHFGKAVPAPMPVEVNATAFSTPKNLTTNPSGSSYTSGSDTDLHKAGAAHPVYAFDPALSSSVGASAAKSATAIASPVSAQVPATGLVRVLKDVLSKLKRQPIL